MPSKIKEWAEREVGRKLKGWEGWLYFVWRISEDGKVIKPLRIMKIWGLDKKEMVVGEVWVCRFWRCGLLRRLEPGKYLLTRKGLRVIADKFGKEVLEKARIDEKIEKEIKGGGL